MHISLNRPFLIRAAFAAGLLLLAGCHSAPEQHSMRAEPQESFETAMLVPENTLGEMRGGFSLPGLRIDFGLNTETSVGGSIVSSLNISGSNFGSGATPQALQQLVQVGSNNTFSNNSPSTLNSNVLTLIQNNVNNVTIQNQSTLSVSVSNFAGLRSQTAFMNSISSMVRALH